MSVLAEICDYFVESGRDKSIDSQATETEEDETSTKLLAETNTTITLVSDAELIERQDRAEEEASTSSDLLSLPITYASDLQEYGYIAADSGSSNMPGNATQDQPKISETSFDVCFSNNPPGITGDLLDPPGKTSVPPVLSVETYKQLEVNYIEQAREEMKKIFTEMTKKRLREMFPDKEMCEQLADNIMNGEPVTINADWEKAEYVYQYYYDWISIESYQCLLITGPLKENEISMRKQEMDKFCSVAFPAKFFDTERLNEIRRSAEVYNCDHIRKIIEDFFQREDGIRAKRALHALIVFFGHGLEQGSFSTWQQQSAGMPLKDIVSLAKYEMGEALKRIPEQLPVRVEIIFAQCYGHLYGEVEQSDRFKVTAFTNDRYAYTCSTRDTSDPEKKFVNLSLQHYARSKGSREVCDMETSRGRGSIYPQSDGNQPDTLTSQDSGMYE